ncbi:MAG: hypothetical protein ACRDE8_10205 [Ginsengibacter sp.]
MTRATQLIMYALLLVVMSSCQKPFLGPQDATQLIPGPPTSAARLSEWYTITNGSSPDTTSLYKIFYDGLGRVHQINTYYYALLADPLFSETTFYYSGNDSNAYKKVDLFSGLPPDNLQTTFYYYDPLQRLMKDSIINSAYISVNQFKYLPKTIILFNTLESLDSIPRYTTERDTGYLNNDGNIYRLSIWQTNVGTMGYFIDFTYDDMPNPFFQLNIHSTFHPLFTVNDITLYPGTQLQKNNLVNITETFPAVYNTRYSYTYNTNGYPSYQNFLLFRNDVAGTVNVFIYL